MREKIKFQAKNLRGQVNCRPKFFDLVLLPYSSFMDDEPLGQHYSNTALLEKRRREKKR